MVAQRSASLHPRTAIVIPIGAMAKKAHPDFKKAHLALYFRLYSLY
jgi:hypothetical protein